MASQLPLIAIDGPAGAGKSSTARQVALRLGLPYLDTGAYYRAAAWAVLKSGIDPKNRDAVIRTVDKAMILSVQTATGVRIWVDFNDVTTDIRSSAVSVAVTPVCEVPEVRRKLVNLQRNWSKRGFGVMEGRDIGTVVLPDARLKIFMTARPEIRAIRRGKENGIEGNPEALAKLTAEITERDRRDSMRSDSPMKQAADAVLMDNSEMTLDEQVSLILRYAAERFNMRLYAASERP